MIKLKNMKYSIQVEARGTEANDELDEIHQWCEEHFNFFEVVHLSCSKIFIFSDEKDIMAFRLRWG